MNIVIKVRCNKLLKLVITLNKSNKQNINYEFHNYYLML